MLYYVKFVYAGSAIYFVNIFINLLLYYLYIYCFHYYLTCLFTYLKSSKMDLLCVGGGHRNEGQKGLPFGHKCQIIGLKSHRNRQNIWVEKNEVQVSSKYYHSKQSTHHRCQSEKTSVKQSPVGRNPRVEGGSQKVD